MSVVLITGINGFLGSNLAKRLMNDHIIVGLEYETDNLFRLKGTDFRVYSSKIESLESIFQESKPEIIIHTATVYRKGNDSIEDLLRANILMPLQLYELANKYIVPYFINTDSFFNSKNLAYNYLGEYTLSKRHLLEWIKVLQKVTRIVNMKLYHVYGPFDSQSKFVTGIATDLLNNIPRIDLTPGEQKRDFIYIEDVVKAFSLVISVLPALNAAYSEYEVGTGLSVSIKEFVSKLANYSKSKSILNFGALSYRDGEIMNAVADNTELKKLGWQVEFDIDNGILKLLDSFGLDRNRA